ncbi:hypothetical protein CUN85_03145 [Methanolobus halotolerans]|uniref:Uncharacterized protein n=1 Tax=Methanolobus halotolerans TaxID=2052935 RepID=A0A4E0R1S7_9EURY|nr:hypothetical protein CUN85_03145 [Methanolobus halotolerans]
MSKGSTLKLVTITVLLLACTATFVNASMFELEIAPVSKIMEDPTAYDSTMAYRKISVIGNISEIGKQSAVITENGHSLKVDVTKTELFSGFSSGEPIMITGEFRHNPLREDTMYPTYVLHYPIQDIGVVNITSINADPATYNGKYVSTIGEITDLDFSMGRFTMTLTDNSTGEHVKVYYYGATDLKNGDDVKVSGLYNGGVLHSENMGMDRSPLSISTLIPGFSSLTGLIALGAVAILLSQRRR